MTATVRSTGQGNSGATAVLSFSPPMPAGFQVGDLLIGIAGNSGAVPATRPSGSTLVQNIPDGTVYNLDIVRKVAVGSDVFTWTVTTTARKWAGAVIAITVGTFDTTTPIQGNVGVAQGTTSSVTFTTPSSTATSADALLIAAFGAQVANTWTCTNTTPSMTELADSTSTGTTPASLGVYRSNTPPPLSSLTRSGTSTLTSANGAAFLMFINPGPPLPKPRIWTNSQRTIQRTSRW